MTRLQAKFRTVVARYGEDLGGAPGVVVPLGLAKARDYLTDPEIDAAARPIWLATVGYDHPATEGATLAWRTRSVLVKRTIDVRFAGKTVSRLLVLFALPVASPPGNGGTLPTESIDAAR